VANQNEIQALRRALDRAGSALEHVYEAVASLDASELTVETWQEASARVGALMAEFDGASKQVNKVFGLTSPRERILVYLRSRVSQVVNKHELSGVAAIYEWARRVRELRVEYGWPISTRTNRADLRPGDYVLEADSPDEELARQWWLGKRIRNDAALPSGKAKGLAYLKELSPNPADMDQLAFVMKIKSYARRLRELEEEGWDIRSNVDEAGLPPGSYRLASQEKRPPRVRRAIKLRHQILERDQFRCKECGRTPDRDGVTLQVHHKIPVNQGGTNDPSNLVTLCADDHAGRHAVAGGRTRDELLDPASEPDDIVR
jgi:HNH endonuclease